MIEDSLPFDAQVSSIEIVSQLDFSEPTGLKCFERNQLNLNLFPTTEKELAKPRLESYNVVSIEKKNFLLLNKRIEIRNEHDNDIEFSSYLPGNSEELNEPRESVFVIEESVTITSFKERKCKICQEGRLQVVNSSELRCQKCASHWCRTCFLKAESYELASNCLENKKGRSSYKHCSLFEKLKWNLTTLIISVLICFMYLNSKLVSTSGCPELIESLFIFAQIPLIIMTCFVLLPFWSTFECL